MNSLTKLLPLLALAFLVFSCSSDPMTSSETPGSSLLSSQELDGSNAQDFEASYTITIENLAPATGPGASQPLSPPVLSTHQSNFRIFHLGGFASDEVRQVAEDAANDPLLDLLNNSDQVSDVQTGGGVILPGHSATITIDANQENHKISFVSMLVNTNDGFIGMDKVNLPRKGSKSFDLRAYDAGTEENTELDEHIPGPCCSSAGVRVPTEEHIRFHEGIQGTGDLDPDVYGWDEPIAKVTIERIN
ncbi:MAG: spondin domain-containing protein [Balneolaceae bacterium]|nr:spondin domain-containing protein [Balneolaceae bacterium]